MSELEVLQAVRLKGRVAVTVIAVSTGLSEADTEETLSTLLEQTLVKGGPNYHITPAGRSRLEQLLADERATIDHDALGQVYEEFHGVNHALKQLVTDWQIRPDGALNDHMDAAYDAEVVQRLLEDLDPRFRPLLGQVVQLALRLSAYSTRFDTAVAALHSGDTNYLAKPIIDSYHTVWFEFHEELIGLLGRTREAEAVAGRAD
jgi:pyruvate,orthophosphate dikinase